MDHDRLSEGLAVGSYSLRHVGRPGDRRRGARRRNRSVDRCPVHRGDQRDRRAHRPWRGTPYAQPADALRGRHKECVDIAAEVEIPRDRCHFKGSRDFLWRARRDLG